MLRLRIHGCRHHQQNLYVGALQVFSLCPRVKRSMSSQCSHRCSHAYHYMPFTLHLLGTTLVLLLIPTTCWLIEHLHTSSRCAAWPSQLHQTPSMACHVTGADALQVQLCHLQRLQQQHRHISRKLPYFPLEWGMALTCTDWWRAKSS